MVRGIDTLHIQLDIQMLIEKLRIEVNGTRQTIHVRGLDDTVLVSIAYGHAVRHVGQRAGETDVMIGAYG